MADPRPRRTIQAQLDMGKEDELVIVQYHDAVKTKGGEYSGFWKRQFVQAVLLYIDLVYENGKYQLAKQFPELAKAKRLYDAISRGDFQVFIDMFPERFNVLRLTIEGEVLERMNQDTQKDLLKEIRAIRAKLDELQTAAPPPPVAGGPKLLNISAIAAPTFDDDDDLLTVKKDNNAGAIASNNFLASLKALNNG